jgi:hypothetical protein
MASIKPVQQAGRGSRAGSPAAQAPPLRHLRRDRFPAVAELGLRQQVAPAGDVLDRIHSAKYATLFEPGQARLAVEKIVAEREWQCLALPNHGVLSPSSTFHLTKYATLCLYYIDYVHIMAYCELRITYERVKINLGNLPFNRRKTLPPPAGRAWIAERRKFANIQANGNFFPCPPPWKPPGGAPGH